MVLLPHNEQGDRSLTRKPVGTQIPKTNGLRHVVSTNLYGTSLRNTTTSLRIDAISFPFSSLDICIICVEHATPKLFKHPFTHASALHVKWPQHHFFIRNNTGFDDVAEFTAIPNPSILSS